MARSPSGSIRSLATVFAADVAITAISNAAEASVTAPGHGAAVGAVVQVVSGWALLTNRAYRVKTVVDANNLVLELADTSDSLLFPSGGGAGTGAVLRRVTTWVQLAQTMNHNTSGGEPQNTEFEYAESNVRFTLFQKFAPITRTFDVDADSISTPGYAAMRTLTARQSDTILRQVAKNGATTFLTCSLALNEEEKDANGIVVCGVSVNGKALSTRYAP